MHVLSYLIFGDAIIVLRLIFDMMQNKRELNTRVSNKEKHWVRITDGGIYEYKEGDAKHAKKVIPYLKTLTLKIVKTQILPNNKHKFIVRVNEDAAALELLIDSKDDLQKLYKIVGTHSIILGLQEVITSFSKIGEGAFAQVYEAVTNYQSKLALKCFEKKGMEGSDKVKKAYYNQIEIMKKLESPYIVAFDYIFQTEKAFYLKMEHFPQTLKDRISHHRKMLVKDQKHFMRNLLFSLEEMRSKGVIHRDLKPDNIMIRKNAKGEEQCVIIDFGLATFVQALPYLYFRCGTPGFLSPEIANLTNKKQKQQPSSDVFSLGCIFYRMLTGHYLFGGKTAKEVLNANRKCQFSGSFDKIAEKELNLLRRMIDSNPNTRITAKEALSHPYFELDVDDCDQIPDEECVLDKKIKQIVHGKVKNMETVYSSMQSFNEQSTTSKAYNVSKMRGLKDSCLTFQLAGSSLNEQDLCKKSLGVSRSAKMQKKTRQSRFSRLNVL